MKIYALCKHRTPSRSLGPYANSYSSAVELCVGADSFFAPDLLVRSNVVVEPYYATWAIFSDFARCATASSFIWSACVRMGGASSVTTCATDCQRFPRIEVLVYVKKAAVTNSIMLKCVTRMTVVPMKPDHRVGGSTAEDNIIEVGFAGLTLNNTS